MDGVISHLTSEEILIKKFAIMTAVSITLRINMHHYIHTYFTPLHRRAFFSKVALEKTELFRASEMAEQQFGLAGGSNEANCVPDLAWAMANRRLIGVAYNVASNSNRASHLIDARNMGKELLLSLRRDFIEEERDRLVVDEETARMEDEADIVGFSCKKIWKECLKGESGSVILETIEFYETKFYPTEVAPTTPPAAPIAPTAVGAAPPGSRPEVPTEVLKFRDDILALKRGEAVAPDES